MHRFFSVVIPTRNRPDLCAVAVKSAAEQEGGDFEVVLVDDGSDDRYAGAWSAIYCSRTAFSVSTSPLSILSAGTAPFGLTA